VLAKPSSQGGTAAPPRLVLRMLSWWYSSAAPISSSVARILERVAEIEPRSVGVVQQGQETCPRRALGLNKPFNVIFGIHNIGQGGWISRHCRNRKPCIGANAIDGDRLLAVTNDNVDHVT